jgi:hypothetical protein
LALVQGAFVGNAVGASISNMNIKEISINFVEKAINLERQAAGLEKGQI